MAWETFPNTRFDIQNTLIQWIYIYTELWWFLCCQREQADEQKVELPVVWAAITLMKH